MTVEFIDTNVLVYAHDRSAGKKRDAAQTLLGRVIDERRGALSVQVLLELSVTLTRKIASPLPLAAVTDIVRDLGTWKVFAPSAQDVVEGLRVADRYRVSLWDAMILVAARALNASVLWSEDLSTGQLYDDVEVRSPFA